VRATLGPGTLGPGRRLGVFLIVGRIFDIAPQSRLMTKMLPISKNARRI
jgi:hypothetical protein